MAGEEEHSCSGGTGVVRPGAFSALLQEIVADIAAGPGLAGEPWDPGLRSGALVGRFELIRELGRGGFGVVWEARDRELGRRVAFKVVRTGARRDLREERLLREAEAAAQLSHPNIVTLHDVGRSESGPYLVLELLEGKTLAGRLGEGGLTIREVVRIGAEVAKGLAHAHGHGVVHRDLKPENVFLCRDGQVKVLDFGLAHAFGQRRQAGGTSGYMAPEQVEGAPEDERTDVWALGAMLFEMLSGTRPFRGKGAPRKGAPRLQVPGLPALGELVARMLAVRPVDRPRDGARVLEVLSAIEQEVERTGVTNAARVKTKRRKAPRRGLAAAPATAGTFVVAKGATPPAVISSTKHAEPCGRCGSEVPPDAAFCPECGSAFIARCPQCGTQDASGDKFCKKCGQPLAAPSARVRDTRLDSPQSHTPKHLADKILASKSALEGERKQVTALFCNIVNSAVLAERLGPEPMHDLLDQLFELALEEVHRYEGTINQFLGDGFMALFGAPLAHEDDARRAVIAALGIQRRLRSWRAEKGNETTGDVRVRMGLNTGFVVIGRIGDNLKMDYTAVGETTNLAAQLKELAGPGEILISETSHRLVQSMVRAELLEPFHVDGKSDPVPAWRLLGLGPRRSPLEERSSRFLGAFVGRQREVGVLHDLFAQMVGGQGQVVGVVGEPGMGKSRVLYEFRRLLANEKVTLLEGRCVSYGGSIPYLPLIDILQNNCGIVESDSPATVTDKVARALREVGMDPDWAAYLLRLFGVKKGTEALDALSPQAIRTRTFETMRQLTLKGSRQRPLVFFVEDLQWIDQTSEEYVTSLVESLAAARILVVTTYRPGYRPAWIDRSYATQITLRPLGRAESLSVVNSASSGTLPDSLSQAILDKAEGNPFFLEELALTVVTDHRTDQAIPDTVQGVLTARIDRLSEQAKRLVRAASVLGREFSLKLLEKVWDDGSPLHPHLLELKRLEFVHERAGGEEPIYVFKHALTQDVAYNGLLTHRRQALHGAAARALEEIHADRLDEVYGALAHHYARSEVADKAVTYLMLMASTAARVYANEEALVHLRDAIVQLERLPASGERDRLAVEVALRQAFSQLFLGRFEQSVNTLLQQQERLEQLRDPSLAGRYYSRLALMQSMMGQAALAGQSGRRAIEEANRCGDEATLGTAHYVLSLEAYWSGRLADGIEHARQAVDLLEGKPGKQWFLGMAYFYAALNSITRGAFDEGLRALARMHAIGETIGDPLLPCWAAFLEGWADAVRGDGESALAACNRSLELAPNLMSHALASGYLGLVHVVRGEPAEALPLLEHAVQEMARFGGGEHWHALFTSILADACRLAGNAERALSLAQRGLEIAQRAGYSVGIGHGQRVLARILRTVGALDEAESRLTEALQTYQRMGAEFEVGRVHLELADLLGHRGDREQARTHLEPARQTFEALSVPHYVARADQLARELALR